MARYEFLMQGYTDSEADLAENVNGIGGKQLAGALRLKLGEAGYACDTVGAEDWGWYFFAQRNAATYLCGAHVLGEEQADGSVEAQAFLEHDRGLFDRLFSRNRPDPSVDPAADLRKALTALPGISALVLAPD